MAISLGVYPIFRHTHVAGVKKKNIQKTVFSHGESKIPAILQKKIFTTRRLAGDPVQILPRMAKDDLVLFST